MKELKKPMKNTLLILTILFYGFCNAQIVNIPDVNFKNKLLSANTTNYVAKDSNGNNMLIDINNDNEIQVSEAQNVYELKVTFSSISNLTGIEAFVNLTELWCDGNQLSNLDVSANTSLTELWSYSNQLTLLDVSANTALTGLSCNVNQLNNLDVSTNTALVWLDCGYNPNLGYINLKNGNNENFETNYSYFGNLPNLQTVCVDELNTDLTDFILSETGHDVEFTINCATVNTLESTVLNFKIYPIPTADMLNIKSKTNITKIEIFSNLGQLVLSKNHKNTINISHLNQGLYFMKITDVNGDFGVEKVIKN